MTAVDGKMNSLPLLGSHPQEKPTAAAAAAYSDDDGGGGGGGRFVWKDIAVI